MMDLGNRLPWQPFDHDGSGNVSFRPAFINNDVPEIGGTPINDDPAPTLEITTTGTVYLEIDVDANGEPETDTAVLKNAASTPADTSTNAYVTIHYVHKSGSGSDVVLRWTPGRTTHLWLSICDGKSRVWQA